MSLTYINFDWSFYFCMLALCTLWNNGWMAITRPGKLFGFVDAFLERKNKIKTPFDKEVAQKYATELENYVFEKVIYAVDVHEVMWENQSHKTVRQQIRDFHELAPEGEDEKRDEMVQVWIAEYMQKEKILSDYSTIQIQLRLEDGEDLKLCFEKTEKVLPDWITDPIGNCITCMASFHSIILYTAVILLHNSSIKPSPFYDQEMFTWNPFEWVIVAIPTAFLGEFLWKIKKLIDLKLSNGKP